MALYTAWHANRLEGGKIIDTPRFTAPITPPLSHGPLPWKSRILQSFADLQFKKKNGSSKKRKAKLQLELLKEMENYFSEIV